MNPAYSGFRKSRSEFPSQGRLCVPGNRLGRTQPLCKPESVTQDAPQLLAIDARRTETTERPHRERPTPSLAFRDLIQRDPTVCNNCFTRTHDAVAFDRWSGVFGWYTLEWWYPRPTRTIPAHHDRMTYGMTSACDCGEISRGGKRRPLSYNETTDYGENLLDTLQEKQIPVNQDEFRGVLRERKRDPSLQGMEDSEVFAPAVEAGIRTASRRSR